jgi:ribonucleoside-triphosphate reductase (thioredoxin)
MLGVGVGFDTKGENSIKVKKPKDEIKIYQIEDSREGWVKSVELLLDSYFKGTETFQFDYSSIRGAGEAIKTFGGISSGPVPLMELHSSIRECLSNQEDKSLSVTCIVDIMNLIGKCVVSGNVRRTAEIAFGEESSEFLNLKDYDINPNRSSYGWTSNNSIFATIGMNYEKISDKIMKNGEPGLAWLSNMRDYSRMNGSPDYLDLRGFVLFLFIFLVGGGNPCLEQSLESYELCCLVETFPDKHEDLNDYLKTLESAFLYAKTVTLGQTHWIESNSVMSRNRRIGCSMSGIAQFIERRGLNELKIWCEEGYKKLKELDKEYSESFGVKESIKITSIKPSGTVSLLNGSTPGMHYPESRFYIRRMRMSKKSVLLDELEKRGYKIEDANEDPLNSVVVEFPIDIGEGIRTSKEVSFWEQLSLASFLQKYWSDNQVSCTVTFDPKEGKDIKNALNFFQYQLKGVSFLPRMERGAYPQMPYEEISKEKFHEEMKNISKLNFRNLESKKEDVEQLGSDKYCDSDRCQV